VHAWDLPNSPDPKAVDWLYYQELMIRAASTVLQPWVGSEERLREVVLTESLQLSLTRSPLRHPALHSLPGQNFLELSPMQADHLMLTG